MDNVRVFFDVWFNENEGFDDDGSWYGEVYSYEMDGRKIKSDTSKDVETTESMDTANGVKQYVEDKYPGATCIHCGK